MPATWSWLWPELNSNRRKQKRKKNRKKTKEEDKHNVKERKEPGRENQLGLMCAMMDRRRVHVAKRWMRQQKRNGAERKRKRKRRKESMGDG